MSGDSARKPFKAVETHGLDSGANIGRKTGEGGTLLNHNPSTKTVMQTVYRLVNNPLEITARKILVPLMS